MEDAVRKHWLVTSIAYESKAHANNQDNVGDKRLIRGLAFLDAGVALDLLSNDESQRMGDALLRCETDEDAFFSLQD
jgi:hypothetical protein